MTARRPYAGKGQVVGLLGGSFDPAHPGHAHLSREAIKRLGLDQLWWLVSPANPLKAHAPASLERRMAQARRVIGSHPKVQITALETQLGARYSFETITTLRRAYPKVRFVWLMGADNLRHFDKWRQWRTITAQVPIAVFARPGEGARALGSRAARVCAPFRIKRASLLAHKPAPAWVFVVMPMRATASSKLRGEGQW